MSDHGKRLASLETHISALIAQCAALSDRADLQHERILRLEQAVQDLTHAQPLLTRLLQRLFPRV